MREDRIEPLNLRARGEFDAGDRRVHAFDLPLPDDLHEGYHRIAILEGGAAIGEGVLIVVPEACYLPPAVTEGARLWGATVQLYGLQSARNAGIGDFTGSAGKPTPMLAKDVERILRSSKLLVDEEDPGVRTTIPFEKGNRVRVKEGYFQNFEGDVDAIDQANGRVTVMINIFGRSTPVELEHWQIEKV